MMLSLTSLRSLIPLARSAASPKMTVAGLWIIIMATGDITISSPAMAITEAALAAMPSILTVTLPSYSLSMV